MGEFLTMIHDSTFVKVIGLAIIAWAFYTLIAHPDRVLFDSIMHKKKQDYEARKKAAEAAAQEEHL